MAKRKSLALLISPFFVLAGLLSLGIIGCQNSPGTSPPTTPPVVPAATSSGSGEVQKPAQATTQKVDYPPFDGAKAFDILKKQCDFGPRVLGTEAHEKTRDYLLAQMKKYADNTFTQEFKYRNMPVTNIFGVFYPEGSDKPDPNPIILMTHWDARPVADGPYATEHLQYQYGPNGWKPTVPVMAANDGASGPGVLLELARIFKAKRPPVGVIIFFEDGEDYGDFQANGGKGDGVLLGATYFAEHYKENKVFGQPSYGILLDMVGGKGLILPREQVSEDKARAINDKVYGVAQTLGYGKVFRSTEIQSVEDSHVPINSAGIPMIDLIHPLPYGDYIQTGYTAWHTTRDTPERCSAQSLKIVGDVLAAVIYQEKPAPK